MRCGPGEDVVVTDPQDDDVGGTCEKVRRVDLGLLPGIGDPMPEFPPEVGMREYGTNPRDPGTPD